jgi:hypothetical protein
VCLCLCVGVIVWTQNCVQQQPYVRTVYRTQQMSSTGAWCIVPYNIFFWTMPSSGIWRRVALVRTDVSEERVASLLVTANVSSSLILSSLMMEGISSSETSVLTTVTRPNIPEDDILHSHRRENLKSYIALAGWSLQWRRNVSPVWYELGFYTPEQGILHSHRRENLKSYVVFIHLSKFVFVKRLSNWSLLR